jgi:hypothetical protein
MPMVFDNANFTDGFAAYTASEVVAYIHGRLGKSAWPRPYDHLSQEGPAWLESWTRDAQPGTAQAAALLLSRIGRQYGRGLMGKAVRLLAMQGGEGASAQARPMLGSRAPHKVAALCQQLIQLTTDGGIMQAFRDQHFPTLMDPANVTADELWAVTDEMALCKLICERWGTNVSGVLDGNPVVLLFETGPKEKPVADSRTPDGLTLEPAGRGRMFAWYQPATRRTYVVGGVKVLPSGITVTDDAIGPDGQPLHANTLGARGKG